MFEALTHERPYKEAWPLEGAIAEIVQQRGDQFHPRIVDAFVSIQDHLAATAVGTEVVSTLDPR